MKSQSMQELVKKIFSDEKTKSQFIADPGSVISQYDLTEPEKRAVLATHANIGLVSGNSHQLAATIEPMTIWF